MGQKGQSHFQDHTGLNIKFDSDNKHKYHFGNDYHAPGTLPIMSQEFNTLLLFIFPTIL